METNFFTEQDLQRLIGQYESIRLDFKASALLSQPPPRIVKQLTEDVSAFANTEGGIIVIGIKESKSGRKSVGAEIDEGVDPSQMSPERLEQLIAGNISPSLTGLVVRPIPLTGTKAGRLAYVVIVPKGTTAYQARQEHKYFGRTEFSAVPLEDHVIRLLMNRGRAPHAIVEIGKVSSTLADEDFRNRQAQLKSEQENEEFIRPERIKFLETPKAESDLYEIDFVIQNDGPITIKDCVLSIAFQEPQEATVTSPPHVLGSRDFQFSANNLTSTQSSGFGVAVESKREMKLFPGQTMPFPDARIGLNVPADTVIKEGAWPALNWMLFLNDAPPVCGSFDIGAEIKKRLFP